MWLGSSIAVAAAYKREIPYSFHCRKMGPGESFFLNLWLAMFPESSYHPLTNEGRGHFCLLGRVLYLMDKFCQ